MSSRHKKDRRYLHDPDLVAGNFVQRFLARRKVYSVSLIASPSIDMISSICPSVAISDGDMAMMSPV